MDRNLTERPYTAAEQRVCDYLQRIASDIGCGDDPIGFLIASHAQINDKRQILKDVNSILKGALRDLGQDPKRILAEKWDPS